MDNYKFKKAYVIRIANYTGVVLFDTVTAWYINAKHFMYNMPSFPLSLAATLATHRS